ALCEAHRVEPAAACIRFALSPPGVASLAMNSSRPTRIATDVAACAGDLPPAFWDALKASAVIDPQYPHVGSSASHVDSPRA
ncbi:MAG: hypothetical protein AAFZ92_01070, partial [Pseudomonadota bacterium]